MEDYKRAWSEAREKMAEARALVKNVFAAGAQQLVKDLEVESFSWTQYTPYFNDGDVCEFGAHIDYPHIEGFNEYGENFKVDEEEWEAAKIAPKEKYQLVRDFLRQFEEDDYLFMFGDHAEVTVTATNIEVEDYEHD